MPIIRYNLIFCDEINLYSRYILYLLIIFIVDFMKKSQKEPFEVQISRLFWSKFSSSGINIYMPGREIYFPSLNSLTLVMNHDCTSPCSSYAKILCSFLDTKILGSHLLIVSIYTKIFSPLLRVFGEEIGINAPSACWRPIFPTTSK